MLGIKSKFTDVDKVIEDYHTIVKVYSFKRARIQDILDKIEWMN